MTTFDELADAAIGGTAAGDDQRDAWMVFNADDVLVGRGHGPLPDLESGWYARYRHDNIALSADPVVIDKAAKEAAEDQINIANAQRDAQVYVEKAACAKMFLDAETINEGTVSPTDPLVIDQSLYECLYDEYWNTYDVSDKTPWTLARAIVAKASKSMNEADRRRRKLLATAVMDTAPPEVPSE